MSALPPVADPTASLPPHSTGAIPAPGAASTLAPNSVAPSPTPVVLATAGRPVTGLGAQAPAATSSVKTSSKSKKKSATVTMATAATAQSAGGQGGSSGENTGRWTAEEHNLFLQGLELHGKGWKKIAGLIKSRTVVQIRTHAQKYFQKLAKAKQNGEDVTMAGGGASNGGSAVGSTMMMGEGGRSGMGGGAVANANGSGLSSSAGVGHSTAHSNKRRKQTSGTKRKAIQSVVASARREGKRKSGARKTSTANPIIDSVAPALAPYVLPTPLSSMNAQQTATAGGTAGIGVSALEDSL